MTKEEAKAETRNSKPNSSRRRKRPCGSAALPMAVTTTWAARKRLLRSGRPSRKRWSNCRRTQERPGLPMETVLSICIGVGLSAACGFRVFVPLLVMSIASLSGHLTLTPAFQWISSYPALIAFSVATALEIAAYYIPWFDHVLDIAGHSDSHRCGNHRHCFRGDGHEPLLEMDACRYRWRGRGWFGSRTTVAARAASSASTGGIGNPVVATIELVGSTLTSVWRSSHRCSRSCYSQ